MSKRILFTDRTRIEEHQRCQRRRFIGYELPASLNASSYPTEASYGITPIKPSVDASIGSGFHAGAAHLLECFIGAPPEVSPESLVNLAITSSLAKAVFLGQQCFDEIWDPYLRDVTFGEISDELIEARAMVEALIRCYAYATSGLLALVSEYEIIEVEKELSWQLSYSNELEIILNARPDGILRHRLTGQYLALSFKTAKEMNDWQKSKGEYDNQGISEMLSAQKAYPDRDIVAVLMVYVLKGRKSKEESGEGEYKSTTWQFNTPLLHPYCIIGARPELNQYEPTNKRVEPKNKSGWGYISKDFHQVDIYGEGHLGVGWWINYLVNEAPKGMEILNKFIFTPLPYYREDKASKSWERQTRAREIGISIHRQDILSAITAHAAPSTIELLIDQAFPMDRVSCKDPFTCSFIKFCHEGGLDDYLYNGATIEEVGYKARKPNHPEYVEIIAIAPKADDNLGADLHSILEPILGGE